MNMFGRITKVEGSQNNAVIISLARFAVDEHNTKEKAILEFVKVVSAKEQVVAGTMYYITLEAKDGEKVNVYEAKIWVKSWSDFMELQDFKLVGGDAKKMKMCGGITEVEGSQTNDAIISLARFAVDEHNDKEKAILEFVKVVSAKEQVVAGMMYYITLEAKDGEKMNVYEAKIWVKSWSDFMELQDFKLVGGDAKKMKMCGGITEVEGSQTNPAIISLARFAVDEHNKKAKAILEFVKVVSAKEQVVAGMMYYITLEAKDGEKMNVYEAKIWVKSWSDFMELQDFKLVGGDAMKMKMCGGITEVEGSQTNAAIISLARFAVDEHNKKEKAILEFVKVVSAKEQVVAGMMYYITLEAKDGEKMNVYEAKIWVKSWSDFMELQDFKLVGGDAKKMKMCGGITEVEGSQTNPAIISLARFAVDEHNKKAKEILEFVKVVSAKEQVVAGMMYYITLEAKDGEKMNVYEAKIWVRSGFMELQDFKLVGGDAKKMKMCGGITEVEGSQTNPAIISLARFAVDEHNDKEKATLEFVKVVSAKEQVVAGMMYYITLEAKDGEKMNVYEAKIWVWSDFMELQDFKLVGGDAKKMEMCGGITEVEGSQTNDAIISLARFAVDEHNDKEKAILEFVKVVSAKEQVVAGMMYYITLEAKDGEKMNVYEAKIWVKSWSDFMELQDFKLVGGDAKKMKMCGGITEVEGSQTNPTIISLARFAVDEHNKKAKAILEFVKVVSAKEQVVAGMMYYITLEAKDGEKMNVYEAKIWVKSWSDFMELQDFKLVGGDAMKMKMCGGITEVEGSQTNAAIISLARFAVDEHNKKEKAILEFVKVVSAKEQVVAGMMYYITLEAKDGEKMNVYEAKIWVKSWSDFMELQDFKLVGGDAKKMKMCGGITEVEGSQTNPAIISLARFAVDEHNKKAKEILEFVKVVSAKEQVVAGMMYYITLEAKDGEKMNVYEAKIWVWSDFMELQDFKLVGGDAKKMKMCGGITEVEGSQTNPAIISLARFAVDEHNKKAKAILEFVKVVNAKEQVVAGTLYYITLEAKDGGKMNVYEAKIWVKSWSDFMELQDFKLVGGDAKKMKMFGGITEVEGSQTNAAIISLARFAVDEHNKKEKAILEFVKVVSAKEQVVAGTMYYITLEAKDGEKMNVYEAKIWVKSWSDFMELQDFKLVGGDAKKMKMCGGITEVEGSQTNAAIISLARFAVDEHNKKENAILEFVKVVGAQKQVVAGTMYYITLEAKDGEKMNVYEAKIWVKSWSDFMELQDFKLVGGDAKKVKMFGGITQVEGSQTNSAIISLARFAVDEHNKKENAILEFVKVVSAQEQVVAGMMYYITLEAKDGEKMNVYEAKIWVKSWSDFMELQDFKLVGGDAKKMKMFGGITEVEGSQTDAAIISLARFAVDEHNKKANAILEFVKVVSAKKQVVAGTMYYITLEAKDGEKMNVYEAKIWVKSWLDFKELQDFKLVVGDAPSVDSATGS